MLTIKFFITEEKPMNFIAVYFGHSCTLWFCKFTSDKYFSSGGNVSLKEYCHKHTISNYNPLIL